MKSRAVEATRTTGKLALTLSVTALNATVTPTVTVVQLASERTVSNGPSVRAHAAAPSPSTEYETRESKVKST